MPTAFQFNSTQLAEIQRLRNIAAEESNKQLAGGGVALYSYIFKAVTGIDMTQSMLSSPIDTVWQANGNVRMPDENRRALTWLYGALQVNSSSGLFSTVIREYNIRQGQLRGMGTFSKEKLDEASNAVAVLFADSILNPTTALGDPNPTYQRLPTVQEIGNTDLNGVRNTLYPGNETPDKELFLNQAWPGIVMLGSLGGKYTDRLLRYNDTQPLALDSLADIKSILFAWDSFKTAYGKTPLSSTTLSDVLIGLNWPASLVSTAVREYAANGAASFPQFIFSTLAANQNPDAKKGLDAIAKIGANKFLDMLMGATVGKSQIGSTTDANFASKANTFFSAYGSTLQTIGAEFLPTGAGGLASKAQIDVNARAALAALSVVSVTAEQFSLYDAATGQGNITQNWITDRAAFTANYYIQQQRGGGIVPGNQNLRYFDKAANIEVLVGAGSAQRVQYLFGGDEADTLDGQGFADHLYGGAGDDNLNGKGGNDDLEGGAGGDTLDGGDGSDKLYGGAGTDTYIFTDAWGKDTIVDSDNTASLKIDGTTLSGGKANGQRNTWAEKLSSGQIIQYQVLDNSASATGKQLVISKQGDSANTITVNNFDLSQALTSTGYLGIKLDPSPRIAVKEGGGANFWSDINANLSSLEGQSSNLAEGTGKLFTVYLNVAAKANDTITLALGDLADKFKAILGDSTVDADGAVITLAEGQTQVSFALVQEGEVTTDGSAGLSVSYQGEDSAAESNTFTLNLQDTGEIARTYNGDQRAKLIGTEIDLNITPDKPSFNTYKWSATSWANDGTLNGGIEEADFADVIYGSSGNDKINGLGGNDALSGGAGNDQIDGGDGDDMIAGGTGSDDIKGGAGNDYISSSAGMSVPQRVRSTDSWSPPGGEEVKVSSATWGVYIGEEAGGGKVTIWAGIGGTDTGGTEGDAVDGGAGKDDIIASWGDDRIDGLAGDDVLEGGDGDDNISGDGIIKEGYWDGPNCPQNRLTSLAAFG